MAIEFESGWLQHTNDNLRTETLARRLVRMASRELVSNPAIEARVWCSAVASGGHVIRITKGLHQPEGPLRDLHHVTMRLYIPGSKQGSLIPDTNYKGKFHLYALVLSPTKDQRSHRLQPTRLSYQTVGNDFNEGADFIKVDIANAEALNSDLTATTL